jgi:Na+-transporting methylmalonyl-CoA/oxaloacetate decarboxylase gamma subunit
LTALSGLVGGLIAGITIVLFVRFGTDLAIPGWTTIVFGFFGVFLFQLILIAIISVLSLLNNRSTPQVIPAADALRYIAERKSVHG